MEIGVGSECCPLQSGIWSPSLLRWMRSEIRAEGIVENLANWREKRAATQNRRLRSSILPAMPRTSWASWNRHQPAAEGAVPTDIHRVHAVAGAYPFRLYDALSVRN